MPSHPVYTILLNGVTEELERKVLSELIDKAGKRVTRPDMVFAIFGKYVQQEELGNDTHDRQIRESIERLQARGFPILATSGQAGYMLGTDEKVLDDYLKELGSRRARIDEKMNHLKASRRWIPILREWAANRPVTQERMF